MPTVHTTNTQPRTGFGLIEVPDPPPLPRGSFTDRFLLESPVAVILIVLAATVVAWSRLRDAVSSGRSIAVAVSGIALSVLIWLIAANVQTPAEHLRETTIALVADTVNSRWESVGSMLHDDCTLTDPFTRDALDKDRILQGVRDRIPTFGIADHAVLEVQASTPNERFGSVQVKIRVNIRGAGVHFSWWRLEFERVSDKEWSVIAIRALSMSGRDAL